MFASFFLLSSHLLHFPSLSSLPSSLHFLHSLSFLHFPPHLTSICSSLHFSFTLIVSFFSGAFVYSIHFWLGAETSQDEAGIAAYKTVELDESLGGGPVQYREVQENESPAFVALFKNRGGLEYLPGGVESGFRKVERDVYVNRLLMVCIIVIIIILFFYYNVIL